MSNLIMSGLGMSNNDETPIVRTRTQLAAIPGRVLEAGDEDASGYGRGAYGSGPYGGLSGEIVDSVGNVTGGVDQIGNITGPREHAFGMNFGGTFGGGEPEEFCVAGPFTAQASEQQISRLATDYANLLPLVRLYERMARDEIERLAGERPNEPESIERNARQRELFAMLADGFAQIAAALEAFASNPNQPVLLGHAQVIVNSVAEQVTAWLKANAKDVTDWGMRLSIMVGAISALGWAGAEMSLATAIAGTMVGGDKVAKAIARLKK